MALPIVAGQKGTIGAEHANSRVPRGAQVHRTDSLGARNVDSTTGSLGVCAGSVMTARLRAEEPRGLAACVQSLLGAWGVGGSSHKRI